MEPSFSSSMPLLAKVPRRALTAFMCPHSSHLCAERRLSKYTLSPGAVNRIRDSVVGDRT